MPFRGLSPGATFPADASSRAERSCKEDAVQKRSQETVNPSDKVEDLAKQRRGWFQPLGALQDSPTEPSS
ncbi:Sterol regulatory element-binding protein 1 [Manis javanica]|nr:Sterol regulatory element-binding protein 1 [Manis javanica]